MNPHDPKDPGLIAQMGADPEVQATSRRLFNLTCRYRYSYNFSWMGRPVIQYPQDLVAMQEILWEVQPDLIVETGVAHGGSLVYYASLLELIGKPAKVLGIDIEIRPHNRAALEAHPMFRRIELLEGSSVSPEIVAQVRQRAAGAQRVLVVLDSNHSHDHVLKELQLYSPLVRAGSYVVVFDTVVEDMDPELVGERPWGKGDNAKTAVHEFLKSNSRFEIDHQIEDKLLLTVAPDGYLRCLQD
ncbi:MAG: cephalosporin hydroxylase family protein [Verrucomicrobia bacterium]|nr:cephalosporin hydroxylase family protein [Verrucomicrobiota bacterium]